MQHSRLMGSREANRTCRPRFRPPTSGTSHREPTLCDHLEFDNQDGGVRTGFQLTMKLIQIGAKGDVQPFDTG